MTTPELIRFVKKEIESGVPRELISSKLKTQGWDDLDIAEVFNIITNPNIVSPPSSVPVSSQSTENIYNLSSIQNFQPNNIINDTLVQSNKTKFFLKFSIIIFLLLVIVGGSFAYVSGYFLTTNQIFKQFRNNSEKINSVAFDIDVNIDASEMKTIKESMNFNNEEFKTFNLKTKGAFDFFDKYNIKMVNSLSLKTGSFEAVVDTRATDGSLYINLTKAPNLGFFSLKPFENNWIKLIDKNDPTKLSDNPFLSSYSPEASLFSDFNDEQKKQITEIFNKSNFIKITKNHLPEIIDGSLSYHFSFEPDREGIILFFKNTTDYIKSINKEDSGFKDFGDNYAKIFDSIKTFQGEAWVGIFDKLPHKILVNMELVNPEKKDDGVAKVTLFAIFSDWNKPIKIEIPTKTITIDELMSKVTGGMFGNNILNNEVNQLEQQSPTVEIDSSDPLALKVSRNKANDASSKSILASIRVQAELFYDSTGVSSYKGFCSSKGQYGAYVLAKTLPENSVYKCRDGVKEWAAYVKLSDSSYWCSDSLGYSSSVTKIPTGTKCKIN